MLNIDNDDSDEDDNSGSESSSERDESNDVILAFIDDDEEEVDRPLSQFKVYSELTHFSFADLVQLKVANTTVVLIVIY